MDDIGVFAGYGFCLLMVFREARRAKEVRKTLMMLPRHAPPGTVIVQRIPGQDPAVQTPSAGRWPPSNAPNTQAMSENDRLRTPERERSQEALPPGQICNDRRVRNLCHGTWNVSPLCFTVPIMDSAEAVSFGVALGHLLPEEQMATATRWTGRALRLARDLDDRDLLASVLRMHGNELRKAGRTAAAMTRLRPGSASRP